MKKVKVCFSTTPLLLSDLIRDFQDSNVSHCYFEFDDERYGETLVYEAKGLNTHLLNKKNIDPNTQVIYEFEADISDEKFSQIMKHIYRNIGMPYAWKTLLGHAIKKIAAWFCIKLKNPWPEPGQICSESVAELMILFFGLKTDVPYDDMDLNWLLEKMKETPRFKMIKGK